MARKKQKNGLLIGAGIAAGLYLLLQTVGRRPQQMVTDFGSGSTNNQSGNLVDLFTTLIPAVKDIFGKKQNREQAISFVIASASQLVNNPNGVRKFSQTLATLSDAEVSSVYDYFKNYLLKRKKLDPSSKLGKAIASINSRTGLLLPLYGNLLGA